MIKEVIDNLTGLGGLPIFGFLIVMFFLLKDYTSSAHIFLGLIICYAVTIGVRMFYFKRRPDKQKYKNVFERIDASSFPSMHSMRAAFLAYFFSSYFNDVIITGFLLIVGAAIAWSRTYLKRHYALDAIIGFLIGLAVGYVVLLF